MTDLKKIALKTLAFVLLIGALSLLYRVILYEKDLNKYSPILLNQINAEKTSDVLYYGESSNYRSHPDDLEKKKISDFTAGFFPGLVFGTIEQAALHAGNYLILLENIPKDSPVKTVIITLNLRSFNADWIYSELETALQKNMVLIDPRFPPFINRVRLSFKDYEIKTDEERHKQVLSAWRNDMLVFPFPFKYDNVIDWDWGMANGHWKDISSLPGDSSIYLACHYIKTYAFQIDTASNPRIKDFDKIVLLAKKRNWNLVLNLMAENVEKAQELVGDEVCWLIRQNKELLMKRYNKSGVIVVDNLEDVPDEEYIDRNWTTEHYAERGRKIIAKNLADSLRSIYPSEYVPQPWINSLNAPDTLKQ